MRLWGTFVCAVIRSNTVSQDKIWTPTWENVPSDICARHRLKSACASSLSAQSRRKTNAEGCGRGRWGGWGVRKPVFLMPNLTVNSDAAPNYKYMFGPHKGPLAHSWNTTVKHIINLYHSLGIFSRRQIDDIFLIFFPENRIWHSMQIVSLGDNLHELSYPVWIWHFIQIAQIVISCFLRKIRKIFQNVVCWKFYPEC